MKKFITLLLCVMMSVSILGVSVYAVASEDTVIYFHEFNPNGPTIGGFNCNPNPQYSSVLGSDANYFDTSSSFKRADFNFDEGKDILGNFSLEYDLVMENTGVLYYYTMELLFDNKAGAEYTTNNHYKKAGVSFENDGKIVIYADKTVVKTIGYYETNQKYSFRYDYNCFDKTYDLYMSGPVKSSANGDAIQYDNEKIGTYNWIYRGNSQYYPYGITRIRYEVGKGTYAWMDNFKVTLQAAEVSSADVINGKTDAGKSEFDLDLNRYLRGDTLNSVVVTKNNVPLTSGYEITYATSTTKLNKLTEGAYTDPTITFDTATAKGDSYSVSFANCLDDRGNAIGDGGILNFAVPSANTDSDTTIQSVAISGVEVSNSASTISGIAGISVAAFEDAMVVNSNDVKFYDANGMRISSDDYATTYLTDGCTVKVTANDETADQTFTFTTSKEFVYNFNNASSSTQIKYKSNQSDAGYNTLFPVVTSEDEYNAEAVAPSGLSGWTQGRMIHHTFFEIGDDVIGAKTVGLKDDLSMYIGAGAGTKPGMPQVLKDLYLPVGSKYVISYQTKTDAANKSSMQIATGHSKARVNNLFKGHGDNAVAFGDNNADGYIYVAGVKKDKFAVGNWYDVAIILDRSISDGAGGYKTVAYMYVNGEYAGEQDVTTYATTADNHFYVDFYVRGVTGVASEAYFDNFKVYETAATNIAAATNGYKLTSALGDVLPNGYIKVPAGTKMEALRNSLSGIPTGYASSIWDNAESTNYSDSDAEATTDAIGNKLVIKDETGNVRSYSIIEEDKFKVISNKGVVAAGDVTIKASAAVTGSVICAVYNSGKLVDVKAIDTSVTDEVTVNLADAGYTIKCFNVADLSDFAPLMEATVVYGK